MQREKILNDLAPCGLDCSRCINFKNGIINKLSGELINNLKDFSKMAKKMSQFVPVLNEYKAFREILDFLAGGTCSGCRNGAGMYPGCTIKECCKEMNVSFCGECSEFPCNKNDFPEELKRKWLENNYQVKDMGIEKFYKTQKKKPRY